MPLILLMLATLNTSYIPFLLFDAGHQVPAVGLVAGGQPFLC